MSAGAAFYASLLVANELEKGLVVTIIPDSGEKACLPLLSQTL